MPILGMFTRFAIGWTLRLALVYAIITGVALVARSSVIIVHVSEEQHEFAYVDPARALTIIPTTQALAGLDVIAWTPDGHYAITLGTPGYIYDSYSARLTTFTPGLDCRWGRPLNNSFICLDQPFGQPINLLDPSTMERTPVFPNYHIRYFELAPDGQRSVFTVQSESNSILYIADSLTSTPRPRVIQIPPIGLGAWSPSGRYIVVSASVDYRNAVFLLDTDTGIMRSLNSDFGIQAEAIRTIAWSPDGSKLVFQAGAVDPATIGHGPLYVLEVSTGNLTQVSEDGTKPLWSPDSHHLVYDTSVIKPVSADGYTIFHYEYAVNVDGTERYEIGQGGTPVWLSDSEHIALLVNGQVVVIDRKAEQPTVVVADFSNHIDVEAVWR